ncbi:hypothetical protein LF887_20970 [Chryseobacterium sp. MEBOG06]|uniref:hypothetical protein n=1 Tax=Chryseobacterium sp. MEBOG06 TaxID=2879938 RepID=UPI001F367A09|nr:hypothetical protein [Chryseobacterium sp. MEBOG06]UKB83451.1 hypothetical protein LF887_20970 [Chryseobacterium sp. MEBOG06]
MMRLDIHSIRVLWNTFNYRKDLRFSSIGQFKTDLSLKLLATYEKSKEANHSMYLQDFGKFVVKELDTKTVSENQYIIEKLNEMQREIKNISDSNMKDIPKEIFTINTNDNKKIKDLVKSLIKELAENIMLALVLKLHRQN